MSDEPPGRVALVRRALLWLVRSNLVIAMAATGVAVSTIAILELPFEPLPLAFVFAATLFAYTINRGLDRAEDATNLPGRRAFIERNGRALFWIAGLAYLAGVWRLIVWRPALLPGALLPPVAAWAYSTGHIKQWLLMKNVFVGLVWACIPLGLGVYYRQLFEPGLLVIAVVFAIVLTVAAAVFDIKDVEGDRLEGIRTVPVVLGVARTRKLCVAGIALAVPAIVAGALVLTPRFFVLLVYVGYLGIAIPLANPDRGELFYGLIVDGEHLAVAGVAASIWLL